MTGGAKVMASDISRRQLLAGAAHGALLAVPFAAGFAHPAEVATYGTGLSEADFRDPPADARPRVWWHWLNGNVTRDGIHKDLEWMKRIGIGGVQTFDVNFSTPTVVDRRLLYMTPEWKDAFRYAASETDRLGLELAIAASPGWSETGGPWVQPADGMKKLVWSETDIPDGTAFDGRISAPPRVTGPFQDVPLAPEPGGNRTEPPSHYADVAVLAYRHRPVPALPTPGYTLTDGTSFDGGVLVDGKFASAVKVPRAGLDEADQIVTITFETPQIARSLNLFCNANTDMFNGATASMTLEAETTPAAWETVARFEPSLVPCTLSFAPVTARRFRLRITPRDTLSPIDKASAPGYAGVNYAAFLAERPLEFFQLRLSQEARVHAFEEKAGFAVARDYYALEKTDIRHEAAVAPDSVIDLTDRLRPDGTLDWTPPPGDWRVLRLGYSLTGKTNHPAPDEATGLEVDKLDGAAVRAYLTRYIDNYREAVGPDLVGRKGINAILTDSTEVGAFNWTPGMPGHFRRLRGYDMLPWLPALTGQIVGSREQSDKFLFDFRRTIADLHASEHYANVARVAHANGLSVYGEALEGWRVSLGDDIDMRGTTDVPMAAMWTFPKDIGPRPLLIADIRTAAASAHLRGKPFVAAESMTSSRFPWAMGPAELRRVVDTEFANGVNRIVIHTSPHQPVDDRKPGLSLRHIGQAFDRHETWAELARPWIDYIARSSLMLQQGRFVADVAYFLGEEAPAGSLAEGAFFADAPATVGYDLVNATAILDLMDADRGSLVTPGGARYRLLYLGGTSERMTLPVLRKVAQLVERGGTIVGNAPRSSPSLADDSQEFDRLVKRLWQGGAVTRFGRGQVIAGKNLAKALDLAGVMPDFVVTNTSGATGAAIDFVHRQSPGADIYFVRNPESAARQAEAHFRVSGKTPEIWRADAGTIEPVSYRIEAGRMAVPLDFEAEESFFVVFRQKARALSVTIRKPDLQPFKTLDGQWRVSFEPDRGAPAQIEFAQLAPLEESIEPGIRYFSGLANYSTDFDLTNAGMGSNRLVIDLGMVGDLAQVSVNGQVAGTAWHAPYRIDIGKFVRPGTNRIEVKVANLWVNRLIGDAQEGAAKIAWTANPMYRADAPLRPSGLIGPVRLLSPT